MSIDDHDVNADVVEDDKEQAIEPIVSAKTKGNVLDVAPGCLAVELPAGYIDGETNHIQAVVREMNGYDEDILAGKGPVLARLNAIVGNCLVQLGSISEKPILRKAATELTGQDRMVLLMAIRRVSLGDFYDFTVTCPECRVSQHKQLNLSEIEIVPMPDRMTRERIDTLPSGADVSWHVIRSDDEEWLSEQRKKKEDYLTLLLLSRVDAIGSVALDRVKGYRAALAALKGLSLKDRVYLRDLFDQQEGNIDRNVEFVCDDCGHQWESKMDFSQSSFFSPSRAT
jgi:hypothetical protein